MIERVERAKTTIGGWACRRTFQLGQLSGEEVLMVVRHLAACLLPLSARAVDVPVSWSFSPTVTGGVTTVSLKQLPQPPFRLPLFAERPAVAGSPAAAAPTHSGWRYF